MSFKQIVMDFAGQAGVNPRLGRLLTDDVLTTISEPGYLNKTNLSGISLLPTDIIFAAYSDGNGGTSIEPFTVSFNDGTISLVPLQGGTLSFLGMQFVSKSGNDLNDGFSYNTPKLTIQAAINTFNPLSTSTKSIQVLDSGVYSESIVIQQNMVINAPLATLAPPVTDDAITLQDLGLNYFSYASFAAINTTSANIATILGVSSGLFLTVATSATGNIHIDGALFLTSPLLVNALINLGASGAFYPTIGAQAAVTFAGNTETNIQGHIGDNYYGKLVTNSSLSGAAKVVYNETVGRNFAATDGNAFIVQTAASNVTYTCPAASTIIPIGTSVKIMKHGAGNVIFAAAGGVTIASTLGAAVEISAASGVATVTKLSATLWVIEGNIAL